MAPSGAPGEKSAGAEAGWSGAGAAAAVFLIGYRASGKTAVGKILSGRLGKTLYDTDAILESELSSTIARYFAEQGEAAFRVKESEVLESIIERIGAGERPVVATGGGIVLAPGNVARMRRSGVVVWLVAAAATLRRRMGGDPETSRARPALRGASSIDEVEEVLNEREPLYRAAAHWSVPTDGLGPEEVAEKVLALLS
jgi:shikimate kinase